MRASASASSTGAGACASTCAANSNAVAAASISRDWRHRRTVCFMASNLRLRSFELSVYRHQKCGQRAAKGAAPCFLPWRTVPASSAVPKGGACRAVWWGFTTMTTVGYGDVYPATAVGRVVGILVMMFGLLCSVFLQPQWRPTSPAHRRPVTRRKRCGQSTHVCKRLNSSSRLLPVNASSNCIQPLHDLGWGGVLTTLQRWRISAGTTRWAVSKSGAHADWPLLTVGSG